MKLNKFLFSIVFCVAGLIFVSCGSQDDIYQEWVKKGGYDYPAKALNLSYTLGYQRVMLHWEKPSDPSVKTCKLFWNNGQDSQEFDYSDYPDGIIETIVDNLEDRSYSFDVVNYDSDGNKSLSEEIIASPYGDGWLSSRTERSVTSAMSNGNDASIKFTRATDEMIATKIRYKNHSDEWVELETQLLPGINEIVLPDAQKGKYFEYASCYQPKGGMDAVWRKWTKSKDAISYALNGSRWSKSATKNQTLEGTSLEYIFDGQINAGSRWHSSKNDDIKAVFPKIISFDTGVTAGDEYCFTAFDLCLNTTSSNLRYIRDVVFYVGANEYDPNTADYLNDFGIPFITEFVNNTSPVYTVSANSGMKGRYLSLVFLSSWNTADGYIDLWELIPYGYIPSQAD